MLPAVPCGRSLVMVFVRSYYVAEAKGNGNGDEWSRRMGRDG